MGYSRSMQIFNLGIEIIVNLLNILYIRILLRMTKIINFQDIENTIKR